MAEDNKTKPEPKSKEVVTQKRDGGWQIRNKAPQGSAKPRPTDTSYRIPYSTRDKKG